MVRASPFGGVPSAAGYYEPVDCNSDCKIRCAPHSGVVDVGSLLSERALETGGDRRFKELKMQVSPGDRRTNLSRESSSGFGSRRLLGSP
jgi:hypothetical protein